MPGEASGKYFSYAQQRPCLSRSRPASVPSTWTIAEKENNEQDTKSIHEMKAAKCLLEDSVNEQFPMVTQLTSERSYPAALRLRYDRFQGQCDRGIYQKLSLSLRVTKA
jgi:hypothetical protein